MGLALGDCTAIENINEKYRIVALGKNAPGFRIIKAGDKVIKEKQNISPFYHRFPFSEILIQDLYLFFYKLQHFRRLPVPDKINSTCICRKTDDVSF